MPCHVRLARLQTFLHICHRALSSKGPKPASLLGARKTSVLVSSMGRESEKNPRHGNAGPGLDPPGLARSRLWSRSGVRDSNATNPIMAPWNEGLCQALRATAPWELWSRNGKWSFGFCQFSVCACLLDESCVRMSSFVAVFLSVLCVLDPNPRLALFRSHSNQYVFTETKRRTRPSFKDNFKGMAECMHICTTNQTNYDHNLNQLNHYTNQFLHLWICCCNIWINWNSVLYESIDLLFKWVTI